MSSIDLSIRGKQGSRTLHWREIKNRVRTHEGELLTGRQAKHYQEKYSKKYLGRDLSNSRPIDVRDVERHEHNESQKKD